MHDFIVFVFFLTLGRRQPIFKTIYFINFKAKHFVSAPANTAGSITELLVCNNQKPQQNFTNAVCSI